MSKRPYTTLTQFFDDIERHFQQVVVPLAARPFMFDYTQDNKRYSVVLYLQPNVRVVVTQSAPGAEPEVREYTLHEFLNQKVPAAYADAHAAVAQQLRTIFPASMWDIKVPTSPAESGVKTGTERNTTAAPATPDDTTPVFVQYRIRPENEPDIEFEAKLVGDEIDGGGTRFYILRVLETRAGNQVLLKIGCSRIPGEKDILAKYEVVKKSAIPASEYEAAVLSFFGYSLAAKKLYHKLGITSFKRTID